MCPDCRSISWTLLHDQSKPAVTAPPVHLWISWFPDLIFSINCSIICPGCLVFTTYKSTEDFAWPVYSAEWSMKSWDAPHTRNTVHKLLMVSSENTHNHGDEIFQKVKLFCLWRICWRNYYNGFKMEIDLNRIGNSGLDQISMCYRIIKDQSQQRLVQLTWPLLPQHMYGI